MQTPRKVKTIAAAAVLFAALAAAGGAQAQSSVTVSGVADLFSGQRQLAGRDKLRTLDSGGMTTSRLSFEGSEDLGGGLKAQFALSGFIRWDVGDVGRVPNEGAWRRYAYAGLQGGFGTFRMGRISTPTFASAIRFGPFADSTQFGPYLLHMFSGAQPLTAALNSSDSAADNAIAYTTPTLGGFSATALYSLGEISGASGRDRYNIGLTWAGGPAAASLTHEDSKTTTTLPAGVTKLVNTQGGASYDLGAVKLFGQLSQSKLTLAAGERKLDTWQLGASVPIGAGAALLSYGTTRKTETRLADVTRKTLSLGYDYNLSRRTDIYLAAVQDKLTGVATGNTAVAGVRHRF